MEEVKITKSKRVMAECSCGCESILFQKDIDGSIYISEYISGWYFYQKPIMKVIRRKLAMIWCAFTGSEYLLSDIVLTDENAKIFEVQMKEFVE
jgi:hypothetical protein